MIPSVQRYAFLILISSLLLLHLPPLLLTAQDSGRGSSWRTGSISAELRPTWYAAPLLGYPLNLWSPTPLGFSFLEEASPERSVVFEYPILFSTGLRLGQWVRELSGLRVEESMQMRMVSGVQMIDGRFRNVPGEIGGVERNEYSMLMMEFGLIAGYDLSHYQLLRTDSSETLGQWYSLVVRGGLTGDFVGDMEQQVVAHPVNPEDSDQFAAHFPEAVDQAGGEGRGLRWVTPNRQNQFGFGLLVGLDLEFRLWGENALSLGVDYRHGIVPLSGEKEVMRILSLHAMMVIGRTLGEPAAP